MLPRVCPLIPGLRWQRLWVIVSMLVLAPHCALAAEAPMSWADKMMSELKSDFGSPAAGVDATKSITITNLYKETVTISEVASTSVDIKARVDKTSLASKETAQLQLILDPVAFGKASDATVTLKMTFDGVNFKQVVVQVMAFIEPGKSSIPAPKPNAAGGNWAEQMLSELEYDFGPVARGAEAKHVITITNLYKENVTLSSPASSCGCITPMLDKYELKSRESAQLTLNLDTVRFSKKRDVTVTLSATFDNLNYKQIRIPIKAYIRSDVVFDPGSVQFGVVAPGETAERRVKVLYAGREGWTVRSVRGSNSHLKPEFKLLSRGNGRVEYELLVKLAGTAPTGPLLDQLVLETDDAANPTIPLLVDGSVEADLQVTPEVVQFGVLKPGVPKVVKVVVKGRKPFRIENVECDSPRECYAVALTKLDQTVHVFSLTITPLDEPGELKEAFTVTIAGRKATLAFQAVGMIEASVAKPADDPKPESTPEATDPNATKESAPPEAPATPEPETTEPNS